MFKNLQKKFITKPVIFAKKDNKIYFSNTVAAAYLILEDNAYITHPREQKGLRWESIDNITSSFINEDIHENEYIFNLRDIKYVDKKLAYFEMNNDRFYFNAEYLLAPADTAKEKENLLFTICQKKNGEYIILIEYVDLADIALRIGFVLPITGVGGVKKC